MMIASVLTTRLSAAVRAAGRLCGGEDGQAASEYALISAAMILGSTASIFFFAPRAINLYNAYIHGFYLLLGLPVP